MSHTVVRANSFSWMGKCQKAAKKNNIANCGYVRRTLQPLQNAIVWPWDRNVAAPFQWLSQFWTIIKWLVITQGLPTVYVIFIRLMRSFNWNWLWMVYNFEGELYGMHWDTVLRDVNERRRGDEMTLPWVMRDRICLHWLQSIYSSLQSLIGTNYLVYLVYHTFELTFPNNYLDWVPCKFGSSCSQRNIILFYFIFLHFKQTV